MNSGHAQAFLGDKLNATRDNPKRSIWANEEVGYRMLECGYSQSNGTAAANLGLSLAVGGNPSRALNVLHDGVKFGNEDCAIYLAVEFRDGDEVTGSIRDEDRADR